MGWLHPKKGVTYLLKAVRLLVDRGESLRLVICGSGDLDDQLRDESHELELDEHVEFRGWVLDDDLVAALHDADVFVLPSLAEGLPNAMLQAMCSGLPVVVTRVDSVPSVITSGENGLLVEPADPPALAEGIARLLHDAPLRAKLAAAGRRTVQANHDVASVWPRVAEALEVNVSETSPARQAEAAPSG